MSHSRIIQLSPVPVTEDNLLSPEDLYDDYKVNAVSEYIDTLPKSYRREEINSLGDTKTISENASITGEQIFFKDCDTIKKNYDKWFNEALQQAAAKAGKYRSSHGVDLRNLFSDYRYETNLYVLDYIDQHGKPFHSTALRSAELVAELAEREMMPHTWYIGAILDSKDA